MSLMKDCQICFAENCTKNYTCFKCKKIICHGCLEMYINASSDFLKCACTEYIFPSCLSGVKNVEKYRQFMLKRIQMNFYNDLTSIKNHMEMKSNIREKRHKIAMHFPICIKYTIDNCFKKELETISIKLEKKQNDMTKICHMTGCNGDIIGSSCNKCCSKYCDFCLEIEEDGHSCKEEDVLSKQFIKSMSISCPNCKLPIEKSSGCSYITCAVCDAKFDHNTNKLTAYGGHSTKIELQDKHIVSREILSKFKEIPKQTVDKIVKLETMDLKFKTTTLSSLDDNEALKYYEKYLKEQKKYKETRKLLNNIRKEDDMKLLIERISHI